jgi:membrane-associated phospholipid phosphatase
MNRLRIGVLAFQLTGLCAATCLAQQELAPSAEASGPLAAVAGGAVEAGPSTPQPGLDLSAVTDRVVDARAFETAPLSVDGPVGDGRRTLGAFPKNLARNFVGLFSRDNLAPFALGSALALGGHALDTRTAQAMQGSCLVCGSSGATAGGFSATVPVVGALFAAGRFAPQGRFRAATYDFAQAMIVNAAWTDALKLALRRERPDGSDNQSLPSGHASNAFALATVASHYYGWKIGVPAYALAAGIGLSRIESNRHYLSDVIAGATLGILVGRTVTRVDGEPARKRRTFAVGPATDARGTGIGLGFSTSW